MPIEHLVSEYFRSARRYGNEDKLRFYSDKRASGILYKDAIIIQQTEESERVESVLLNELLSCFNKNSHITAKISKFLPASEDFAPFQESVRVPYEIIRKLDLFIGVTGNSKYSPDLQITTPGARYTMPQLALASKNLDFLTELYYMGANPKHKFSTLKGINRCENKKIIGEYSLFTTFNELFKMLNNFNPGVENLVFFSKYLDQVEFDLFPQYIPKKLVNIMLSYLDAPQANQIRVNQLPGSYEEVELLPTHIPKSLNCIIMSYLDPEQAQKINHAIETDQVLGFGYTERIKKLVTKHITDGVERRINETTQFQLLVCLKKVNIANLVVDAILDVKDIYQNNLVKNDAYSYAHKMTTPLAKISQAALLYFHESSSPFLMIAPSIIPAASHLYHGKYYEAFTSVFTYTVVGLFSLSTAIMLTSKINILDDCATTHCISTSTVFSAQATFSTIVAITNTLSRIKKDVYHSFFDSDELESIEELYYNGTEPICNYIEQ